VRNRRRPRVHGREITLLHCFIVEPLISASYFGAGGETDSEESKGADVHGLAFSTIGRGINELIEAHATLLECQPTTCLFVCECENGDCEGQIEVTLQRYRQIRKDPSSFMIVAGHESEDDSVVKREASWLIVKKARR
jgi:hypothetical protein